VEATVRVSQLNRRVMVERTTSLDFHNRRLAEKDRDLRDVADLVRTNGLGPLDAATLDQTITRILDGDRSIELYPSADRLAFVSGPADFNADVVLTRLGLLPDWVFESGFDLELIPRVPGMTQEVRLVARKNGVTRVIADLSSEYGYRLTRLRLNSDQGELLQDTLLTGFRKVGGRWVPSEVNVRVMRPGDRQELRIERHQIRQVDFNVEIEPTEFRIPSNYRIQSVSP